MKERPILFSGPLVRAILDGRKTQTRRLVGDLRVVPRRDVGSDMPSAVFGATGPTADAMDSAIGRVCISGGRRYRADMNPHGAVFAELGDEGRLGLKPGEFDFACPYADGRTYRDDGWRVDVAPGQRLWVKESWQTAIGLDDLKPTAIGEKALDAGYARPWAPLRYDADAYERDRRTLPDFGRRWGKARNPRFMPRWASRLTLEVTAVRVQRVQDITEEDARAEGVLPPDAATAKQDTVDVEGVSPYRAAFACLWESINGKRAPWSSNPWVWTVTFRRVTP